jgi:cyclomaltodextrinase
LLAVFKRLIKMRRDHPVLRHGALSAPLFIDENLIVLLRRQGTTCAVTASNNSNLEKTVTVKLPDACASAEFVDALHGGLGHASEGAIKLTVPALFGTALVSH